ncbi:MAG: ABC transporter ATP-binding protein [Christensenella sp.]
MGKIAVGVDHVTKIYPLYQRKSDRLKEALHLTHKKVHDDFYALKDISFSIREGECVGFVGKNGCGKSTLLKILTGVLTPSVGTFHTEGKISALLELGAGFNFDYTGIENIYLNGAVMGFTRGEMAKKVDSILEFADIGEFAYQPVKMYSSGMFVRLAFAVAINVEPDILIVDEALSVGDIFFQQKCYKKFQDFKNAGKTILFVTHDMGSVIKYCNRAFLMNDGELISEGTPKQIVDQYKKLMAGIDFTPSLQGAHGDVVHEEEHIEEEKHEITGDWKAQYALNPEHIEYGDKELEIVDFGIFDENDNIVTTCNKGERYSVKMKVKVNNIENIKEPIFALSFKDIKGTEITGSNTSYENTPLPEMKNGDEIVVSFEQEMNFQVFQYFISLGCTEYLPDGNLKIYHRLYDVMALNMLAEKITLGYFDMNSEISVTKEGN